MVERLGAASPRRKSEEICFASSPSDTMREPSGSFLGPNIANKRLDGPPEESQAAVQGTVRRLKELEAENTRLRKAVADLTLEKLILKEAAS
jgi:hypothetical protein